jgi:hypothetical protein
MIRRWVRRERGSRRRPHTLRQAASVVFALISVLPLLTFAYSLYTLNAINQLQYQTGLGLALVVAVLGFAIFRSIVTRMSDLVQTIAQAAAGGAVAAASPSEDSTVPGMAPIREFDEMSELVNRLWKAEAELHLGHHVSVAVKNAPEPLAGTLARVTDQGIILDGGTVETAIAYRRILAIDGNERRSKGRGAHPSL